MILRRKSLLFCKLFCIFAVLKTNDNDGSIPTHIIDEAKKFLDNIPQNAHKKVLYNMWRVSGGEKNIELFKKLEKSEIWEFRTLYIGIAYRLFAFWDTEEKTLVVATHGIIKKTQKTPSKEIAKAEAIRKEYFKNK